MMLPENRQSKSLSGRNIPSEKRETEAESWWVTFLKAFSSPSVSHVLWNQAPCYPGAIFHEMELNMSLITSTGCLDNHTEKSQTWRSLQLHHGSQSTVDVVSIITRQRAPGNHPFYCFCSAHSHLFTYLGNWPKMIFFFFLNSCLFWPPHSEPSDL